MSDASGDATPPRSLAGHLVERSGGPATILRELRATRIEHLERSGGLWWIDGVDGDGHEVRGAGTLQAGANADGVIFVTGHVDGAHRLELGPAEVVGWLEAWLDEHHLERGSIAFTWRDGSIRGPFDRRSPEASG